MNVNLVIVVLYLVVTPVVGALVTFSVMFVLGKHFGKLSHPCDSNLVISKI